VFGALQDDGRNVWGHWFAKRGEVIVENRISIFLVPASEAE
jgi:hypothetical protein